MYYVQLVDDEPIIRNGLSKMIDWESLGFEIACLSQNGKQALEQLEIEKVDLIITDIEMPVMDGLTFISEVREMENSLEPKEIIVITAYDDFEYAKTAIRYGVAGYMLKPVDSDELAKVILQVKANLDQKRGL